ncbi:HAD-IIA family hydrolase [Marivita cryptomonadis]|uniref:HAD-IIA family hydrolase n=2 Tax=Roseobacteraceae TaxID=2854170 RepID=A0A9Q2NWT7_9RHOB|nr:HAD-IIA family hydrolase [Marivita cryptomonadis]MBM2332091.1 HAD-IIA family hydrolase [Marivita cryptomonadis]MBM2341675.1 HAD-IIA family hydrolase [Marivita cryptomonadis]MBM2346339.1 HAD-IIA family hydrolase [Marivita cryptomonadis]MBM2351016.1 HAD-IIA family hydrolase [Marivita cryptomonadis]
MGVCKSPRSDHLTVMSTETAFEAYEAVRHRLPLVAPSGTAFRRAATLADIADGFDVFLLDAFGVLNIGEAAIPGTPERIRNLKAAGKRVLVVSNAAGFPHAALMEKYTRLGYDFAPDDVITSRVTLLAGLNGRQNLHWGLMATRSTGLRDLEDLNLTYLEEDPAPYDAVEGILLVGSAAWTEERQALLEDSLRKRPRPVLVGNPDIVAPRETGFSVEPGHFAHRLADRTGITPEFYGKPFPDIFDLAFKRLGDVDRSRVLMVGDSLHTDILGARNIGISSALIAQYGFFAGQDAEKAVLATGIVPDFIVERP